MAKRRPSGDGMVRKREDGRWEGRIVAGHKENGDSIFRYIYADTQKELTAKLRQHIDIYQGVDLTEQSRMTLGEWMDQWLENITGTSVVAKSVRLRFRQQPTAIAENCAHYLAPPFKSEALGFGFSFSRFFAAAYMGVDAQHAEATKFCLCVLHFGELSVYISKSKVNGF